MGPGGYSQNCLGVIGDGVVDGVDVNFVVIFVGTAARSVGGVVGVD